VIELRQGWPQWQRYRSVLTVAAPAAGADWSLTVPAGHIYEVLSIQASLVTSAAVATRQVSLTLSNGVAVFLTLAAGFSQLTGLTRRYAWYPFANPYTVLPDGINEIPTTILQGLSIIASSTALIDAGDQWSAVKLQVVDTLVSSNPLYVSGMPDYVAEQASVVTAEIPAIYYEDQSK